MVEHNLASFTCKANLRTSEVETHTRQKLCHFSCYDVKVTWVAKSKKQDLSNKEKRGEARSLKPCQPS